MADRERLRLNRFHRFCGLDLGKGCMTFRPSHSGPSHSGPLFRGPELFAVQAHFFRNSGPNY